MKPEETKAIQKIERASHNLVLVAQAQLVRSQTDADGANVILSNLSAGLKEAERQRKEITGPINAGLKKINEMVKKAIAPAKKAKEELSTRLLAWRAGEQKKRDEEQRAREEEARKKDEMRAKVQATHAAKGHETTELEPTEVEDVASIDETDETRTRKQLVCKVTDASKVPSDFVFNDLAYICRKMCSQDEDDNFTGQIMVAKTDKPGLFLFVDLINVRDELQDEVKRIPGITATTREIGIY